MSDQISSDKETLKGLVCRQLDVMRLSGTIVEEYDYSSDLDLQKLSEEWEARKLSYDEYSTALQPHIDKYQTQFLTAEEELFKIGHDSIPVAFQYLLQSENPQPIDFKLFGHLVDVMSTPEDLPVLTEALELAIYKQCNRYMELREETPDPEAPNVWGGIHKLSELQKDPYSIFTITEGIIRNIYTAYDQNNEGIKSTFGSLSKRLSNINEVLIKEGAEETEIQHYQPLQSENIFMALALLKHQDPKTQEYLEKYNFVGAIGDDMSELTKDWRNLSRIYQVPKRGMLIYEGRYPWNEYVDQGITER